MHKSNAETKMSQNNPHCRPITTVHVYLVTLLHIQLAYSWMVMEDSLNHSFFYSKVKG